MDSTLRLLAFLLMLGSGAASAANHEVVSNPLSPGRFVVACSNVEMDAGAIARAGVPAEDFWEGRNRYIGEILTQPQTALRFNARVPLQFNLYPRYSGRNIDSVAIVCHPTSRQNTDANYTLPGSNGQVPRMQPPGQAPKFISQAEFEATVGFSSSSSTFVITGESPPARLPLIVYSHGLAGSPISKGYIDVMVQLASQGYVVAAMFHGDPRFSSVRVEDLVDAFFAIAFFDFIVEMQALRPLTLSYMLDLLLDHPWWAPGIDRDRIAGFGASMGGQAMAHLMGARITSSLTGGCRETVRDPRIKAAFTFVPYGGHSLLPAFCRDQEGAAEVSRPFFAMTGSFDTTAPESEMERALRRMRGTRYQVSLQGGQHELRAEDAGDLFTWMVTFYDAYLQLPWKPNAMGQLIKLAQVNGGRPDVLKMDVHVPTGPEPVAREFWNSDLNHYFITSSQADVDFIQRGDAGPGWHLTGQGFKVFSQMPADPSLASPVCRFYGAYVGGPNSHFFTADPGECEFVKRAGGWYLEGISFYVRPVSAGKTCPFGMLQVQRLYNNRYYPWNDSNHRYTTSDSTVREMRNLGWIDEGAVMCARP